MKAKQFLIFSIVILTQSFKAMSAPITKWEKLDPNEDKEMIETGELLVGQGKENYINKNLRNLRDAHPHAIGCVAASFKVNNDIPNTYQTGVFSEPGKTYDALIRFSSSFGPAGDNVKDARGLAIKLFGVPGTKLLAEQANAVTQDFIHIDHPIFPARNAHQFQGIIRIGSDKSYMNKFLLESPISNALALKNL
ncbi:MAG: catalase, partial [Proteobacteria bacterium]|nr:catalase [Pseudomonadota bacterium]